MSEATVADIVRVAREMAGKGDNAVITRQLRGRFGKMPAKQFNALLEMAIGTGKLTRLSEVIVAIPKSKYDELQVNTAENGLDYVADAFRKLGIVRDKLNGNCTEAEYRALVWDIDQIRDQLETWLSDRDYVASIP